MESRGSFFVHKLIEELRVGAKELADSSELNWEALESPDVLKYIDQKISGIPMLEALLEDMMEKSDLFSIYTIRQTTDHLLYTYALREIMDRKNTIESMLQSL